MHQAESSPSPTPAPLPPPVPQTQRAPKRSHDKSGTTSEKQQFDSKRKRKNKDTDPTPESTNAKPTSAAVAAQMPSATMTATVPPSSVVAAAAATTTPTVVPPTRTKDEYKNGENSNHSTDSTKFITPPNSAAGSGLPNDYMSELKDLQHKIMNLQDNNELQQVVEMIAATGQYEITSKTFDFDLCALDRSTVERLVNFFHLRS